MDPGQSSAAFAVRCAPRGQRPAWCNPRTLTAIRSSPSSPGLTALCAGRTGLLLVLIGYIDRTTAAFNASVAETRCRTRPRGASSAAIVGADLRSRGIQLAY